jgi:hypothetical protein
MDSGWCRTKEEKRNQRGRERKKKREKLIVEKKEKSGIFCPRQWKNDTSQRQYQNVRRRYISMMQMKQTYDKLRIIHNDHARNI